MGYFKWKPSKSDKIEFAAKMKEIDQFCADHGIEASSSNDSYYFDVNGQRYRVSNHSIEASNAAAYDAFGHQIREKYHDDKRRDDIVYIHASKTRIIEIYNDLLAGFALDGRGNRKTSK